ncbi:DegT/DnrJ/EryC1/StrS family aminotransferase [Eubacterium oxidoreducens]|uniref:dTDP-4-amino-4,6-dideoxygalactose transaminase n=1 Tax=Eubacterium oxidoreducens TaxID=1732 RepID=A0A1G6BL08_EUBOX|nr:aminotransferase class I/II-fold pyridoxal phosphate-dependent enzyme [Eubacterium oxidoreducens]SDB21278.1 dTDP-4-amino-4,6-dideoxygalactose transaminase [Eubacterium oxidoreducens]
MADRIYLASPTMHAEEQEYVKEAFDTNWIAPLGPNVNAFEQELMMYTNAAGCAALSSGTAALHLAVKLLNIQEGDVVLCSTFTFAASCNPVAYEKGKLVFIDSEPETWNMSPKALRRALEKYPNAKAVLYVHLYGTPAKVDEIMAICAEYDVPLIEDAAESLGATYKGVQTGNFGEFSALSFNGNKIITTSGGGALLTRKEEDAQRARFLSTQAREPKPYYEHKVLGYNYRMSNIVAGVGRGQLKHIKEHIALKKKIYETYEKAFLEYPITMNPYEKEVAEPNFWLSAFTIDRGCMLKPEKIYEALAAENIESRPLWNPMHKQPVYEQCDFVTEEGLETKPVSSDLFERGLCLPSDIKNTKEDMDRIIKIIKSCF